MKTIRALLIDHFEYYGLNVNANQIRLWEQDLIDFTAFEVSEAIKILQKRPERTRPATPALMRDKIMGYESAEEALASVPQTYDDEYRTFVITDPARLAWGATRHLQQESHFSFSKAFAAAYELELQNIKKLNQRAKYSIMEGTDKELRDQVLKESVAKGKISTNFALSFSPYLRLEAPKQVIGIKAPERIMIEAPKEFEMDDETRERNLKNLRELLETISNKQEVNQC